MNNGSQSYKGQFFYISVAGIFLIIISPYFLSDGMFADGTLYATISKNMANGSGTFWSPHFTDTFFPEFHEHPPLALALESVFFRIFGDSRFVERFYSVLTIVITGMIIVSIWKKLDQKSYTGWLPLLFWISMPIITWTSVNNMLDNTLGIFLCLSVLFYIKGQKLHRLYFVFLSGLMLTLGFLTKGFVTFFPLAFPFIFWLFIRQTTFRKMMGDTFLLIISSVTPLVLIYFFTGANKFFSAFFKVEFDSILYVVTKESRFYILYRLLMELLPGLIMILLFLLYCRRKKHPLSQLSINVRPALAFFLLGLAGVLPIMISVEQSNYYLLPSLSFFAISLSLPLIPFVEPLMKRVTSSISGYRFIKYFGITVLLLGIVLSAYFSGSINRNRNMLIDSRVIMARLEENSTVNILPEMYSDYSLHTYYGRYKDISLDPDLNNLHEYLLIRKSLYSDTINNRFDKIELPTNEFDLFRRKKSDYQ